MAKSDPKKLSARSLHPSGGGEASPKNDKRSLQKIDDLEENFEKLSSEDRKLLKKISELSENDVSIVKIVQSAVSSYSGPVPSPKMLEHYEKIQPGSADRLIKLTENEQGIRKFGNRHTLWNESFKIFGAIVVTLCVLASAAYFVSIGQPLIGGPLAVFVVLPRIIGFFLSKK